MSFLATEELDTQHVDPPEFVAGNIDVAEVSTPDTPDLRHSDLRTDEFWRRIPGFAQVTAAEFHTHMFQARHTATNIRQIEDLLRDRASESFFEDVALGVERAPMALRVSPYLLSLIDWDDPHHDPIRTQFLPLASQQLPNHPELRLDSLAEQRDSPVPGLTHRYRDKALFLPIVTCPVYCRFCTRSYAIGGDTGTVEKLKLAGTLERWETAFRYIESRPELEDIVISGGDAYNLRSTHIQLIGERLLKMPNIRRIRYATKGLAVMPQKILSDDAWLDALTSVFELGRKLHKDVVIHTHFNHPNEITGVTRSAMNRLTERGITVRCQTVLQNGVNNDSATMQLLVRRLGFINIHPTTFTSTTWFPAWKTCALRSIRGCESRSTCEARPQASTRRTSWWTQWAVAENATPTRLSITIAKPGLRFSRARALDPACGFCISIQSVRLTKRLKCAGAFRRNASG
jgi:lysine 2,3-aminomutase